MAPKGKGGKSAREPSPARDEDEPALDDEPEQPPVEERKKKKKGGAKKRAAEPEPEAEPVVAQAPTKQPPKKRAKKATPDPEPEEEEEEVPADDVGGEAVGIGAEALTEYFKTYRKEHHKLPPPEALAETFEIDVDAAKNVIKKKKALQDKLTNQRVAKKVKGYDKMSIQAGYGNFSVAMKDDDSYSMPIARGVDARTPVISMSDVLRMATALPPNPAMTSYTKEEFARRLANADTRLPVEACRVLQANANALFNNIHYAAMSTVTQQCKTQKIRASHAVALLKPYAEQMSFSSVLAPPGLVQYGKEIGVLPEADGDAERKKENGTNAKANAAAHKAWVESQTPKKPSVVAA